MASARSDKKNEVEMNAQKFKRRFNNDGHTIEFDKFLSIVTFIPSKKADIEFVYDVVKFYMTDPNLFPKLIAPSPKSVMLDAEQYKTYQKMKTANLELTREMLNMIMFSKVSIERTERFERSMDMILSELPKQDMFKGSKTDYKGFGNAVKEIFRDTRDPKLKDLKDLADEGLFVNVGNLARMQEKEDNMFQFCLGFQAVRFQKLDNKKKSMLLAPDMIKKPRAALDIVRDASSKGDPVPTCSIKLTGSVGLLEKPERDGKEESSEDEKGGSESEGGADEAEKSASESEKDEEEDDSPLRPRKHHKSAPKRPEDAKADAKTAPKRDDARKKPAKKDAAPAPEPEVARKKLEEVEVEEKKNVELFDTFIRFAPEEKEEETEDEKDKPATAGKRAREEPKAAKEKEGEKAKEGAAAGKRGRAKAAPKKELSAEDIQKSMDEVLDEFRNAKKDADKDTIVGMLSRMKENIAKAFMEKDKGKKRLFQLQLYALYTKRFDGNKNALDAFEEFGLAKNKKGALILDKITTKEKQEIADMNVES